MASNGNDIGESSGSQSLKRFKYQVFVNFRGTDVRMGFIDHLCRCLKAEGVRVFLDNLDMKYGEEIMPMLYQAIEDSQLHVVTFSPRYAESKWCLKELEKIMSCKASSSGHHVLPVFYNVEPRDVRHQSGPYAEAFSNPEVLSQADKGTLSGYKTALGQIGNLKGFSLDEVNGYEGQLVDNVVQEVINIVCPRKLFVKENIIGRYSIIEDISMWLKSVSDNVEVGVIYGAGGMGKSTISQIVFNNNLYKFTGACYVADFQRESSEYKGLNCILEQIISDVSKKPLTKISNVPSGLKQVKDVLSRTKTLLILDDVEDLTQIESMFDPPSFFYPGSKIIITTRNRDIRNIWKHVKEFSVEKLDDTQSHKLFYLNAFQSDQPPKEYISLSKKIIKYCDGLPLALCILASSLSGESVEFWGYMLDKLATGPNEKVHSILKLSFDSIKDKDTKELFLDIAHYFVGVEKDYAFTFLDGLTPYLNVLFPKLVARCLVTIDENGKLMMHQLIQEMAVEVVRQEAHHGPGHCSRLSNYKESLQVIQEKKGTDKVRCLRLHPMYGAYGLLRWPVFLPTKLEHAQLSTDGFRNMENLMFLHLYNAELTGCYSNMPKKIKCLEWRNCLLESIPAKFKLDGLVVLQMRYSRLVRVWESTQDIMIFKALKVLNLRNSRRLEETPDLSGCPALECIVLESCPKLIKIHESITQLTKLTYLNVNCCSSLRRIPCPSSISMDAYSCSELVEIGDNITLELRRNMGSECCKYMGYPGLESYYIPDTHQYRHSKVEYQFGIFSVFFDGDHIGKWFTRLRQGLGLTYTVPDEPDRRIRAFNVCCVYNSYDNTAETQLEVQVHNQSRTKKWLFIPILNPQRTYIKKHTWLIHWPVTEHRELNAGDTLEVTFHIKVDTGYASNGQMKCGIEVLYDDESEYEEAYRVQSSKDEVEVEPGVFHFRRPSINLISFDPFKTCYVKDRG